MKNLSRFYHEMIRENFVEELRKNLNLSRVKFHEMSQLSLFIPTPDNIVESWFDMSIYGRTPGRLKGCPFHLASLQSK